MAAEVSLTRARIGQMCLEPIGDARLDIHLFLYLPGLSLTITRYYRALVLFGASGKWQGFQERPHGILFAKRRALGACLLQ
jgi:hypothetical protein